MMPEREFTINACRELENVLSHYEFKTLSKGLRFKRKLNEDITQEISFQITSYFNIIVHISVCSLKVKKWNIDNFAKENDIIVSTQLGYLTPLQEWKSWTVMKSEIAKKQFQKEVLFQIEQYIIPFFNKFQNIDLIIEELIENNGRWTINDKKTNTLPIIPVLAYKTIEDGQRLFNNFLKENKVYIKRIKEHNLDTTVDFDFNCSEFWGAINFKIAFDKGLKINHIS